MADDKLVIDGVFNIAQVTGMDRIERDLSKSTTKQFKTIQAQMGAVQREFFSKENLLSREMSKISKYKGQFFNARDILLKTDRHYMNNLDRVFADIFPHQYQSDVLSRANKSQVFRGKNARYHQATNTGAISASLIDKQFGIGVENADLARLKNYYSGLELSSRVKENIKLFGAGSKSDIRKRQKVFGHLDALSASLLGNDYESRLIRESISNAVGASNASITFGKNTSSGVSLLDYINNATGVYGNEDLARMRQYYLSKTQKGSDLQKVLQNSSYSNPFKKLEDKAIKQTKSLDIAESNNEIEAIKIRQKAFLDFLKEKRSLLNKENKLQIEKQKADKKEQKERDKHRKALVKDIDKIANFAYGWSKALIAGSLAGGAYTLKNWTQGATQTALNREVINSTMGRQYGAGIQNWASMLYKYGGVSREQSYGMFKNLHALYGKALMGDANASKLFGALSIDQLSGDPIKMLRQLIHGFRGLDKATRMDVANQLGISDNALVAFDRMSQMGTASSKDFLATNLNESELGRLTTFGESIREMSDTWKNFKDVMVAHSASLDAEAKAVSELLQKGIKIIRDKKGDFVNEIMKRTADNLNLVNTFNPFNWVGRGLAWMVNDLEGVASDRNKNKQKEKMLSFMASQPSIGPVSDFVGNNAEYNPIKYGNSNIEVGGITVNIEAKTEDGRIDTDDFMTKFTSAIGNQLKTTFFNAEDATLNMGR